MDCPPTQLSTVLGHSSHRRISARNDRPCCNRSWKHRRQHGGVSAILQGALCPICSLRRYAGKTALTFVALQLGMPRPLRDQHSRGLLPDLGRALSAVPRASSARDRYAFVGQRNGDVTDRCGMRRGGRNRIAGGTASTGGRRRRYPVMVGPSSSRGLPLADDSQFRRRQPQQRRGNIQGPVDSTRTPS